jgi:hypothetical protein
MSARAEVEPSITGLTFNRPVKRSRFSEEQTIAILVASGRDAAPESRQFGNFAPDLLARNRTTR